MRPFRLKPRRRVGKRTVREPEFVKHPGRRIGNVSGKVTLLLSLQPGGLHRARGKPGVLTKLHGDRV